ncbi:MAG: right-handed parallel beta-helix repeat-containing protein [Clostridia bacterium]|nr:right-handed parallel beta-helix repeat-containing protein [Clostridia bacterium]
MKKKILAILLAAIMVAMLLPMAAFAEAGSITTWKALQDAITKVGTTETTIQLTCDITALETDSSLTIGEGQKITIDLNGFVLNRGMFDSDGNLISYYRDHGDTYQIIVKGELTIKDSNPTKTHQFGVITEGDDKGVWYLNEASGTNKVAGGIFTGCFRGAVSVDGGKFTLESGNIIGNVADEGRVDVDHGTFVMNGGMIMGNRSVSGDCVCINNNSCFIMNNGEIRSNIAPEGSAVYIYKSSTFTMNNGKISDNKGFTVGGVRAANSSLFEMNGGEISGNLGNNGGIYLEYGSTFKMHGGKIINNGSDESTIGGVHITTGDASFIMDGGLISGNTGNYAGGVCSEESKSILGGKAQIKGNTVDDGSLGNVLILDRANIELGTGANGVVAPQDGFSVGVTTMKAPASGTPVVFSSNGSASDTK